MAVQAHSVVRALALAIVALALIAPAASAGGIRAGVAEVDASWHVGAAAGQYASTGTPAGDHGTNPSAESTRRAPSYGIQTRLHARALVVEGPDGKRFAVLKNDLYIPQDLLWRRTAQILEAAGSKVGRNLVMAVSHSHSSPYYSSISWGVWAFQDVFDARFFEYYAQRQAQAVLTAERNLVAARVGATTSYFDKTHKHSFGPTIAEDGTPAGYPEWDADHELVVVRFDDISGARPKPLAVLTNWGNHGEGLNGNDLISGDWFAALERDVDRKTGAMLMFTQGAVGTAEMERSRYHDIHERLEFNHREYIQNDYNANLLGNAIVGAWRDIAEGRPSSPSSKFIGFRSQFDAAEVQFDDRWFPGPISHPYPGVSSCRTDRIFEANPQVPIAGFPDCVGPGSESREWKAAGKALQQATGLDSDTFQQLGIPLPENYSAPSYTGLQEDVNVHLQAFRIGDLLVAVCSCEQWKDSTLNIKTRTDKVRGNEYKGFDWFRYCRQNPDGTWNCPNPEARDPDPANPSAWLTNLSDKVVRRMHAQVVNDAKGWNDPSCNEQGCGFQAESEPTDHRKIRGNFTHDDDQRSADLGYEITATVSMATDYNGYIASYREYQRGDHYRKALTAYGPHSMDYLSTRLVNMGRRFKDWTVDPRDAGDKLIEGKIAPDQAHNDERAARIGALGQAAIEAWNRTLPDNGGSAQVVEQPKDIERFDVAFLRWNGGDNYTDQPVVRVQRLVDGEWRDFANQRGEIPVTLAFSQLPDAPGFLPTYLGGQRQWIWTAHFEAFSSFFDTGLVRSTPAGTYRFVVDGARRQGRAAVPYHLESRAFEIKRWSGITVEDLRTEPDGTVSFAVGPRREVLGWDINTTENLRGASSPKDNNRRKLALGPIDYTNSYEDAQHPQRAAFIKDVHSYRAEPGYPLGAIDSLLDPRRIETYCLTCSFRPWQDMGDAVTAYVTFVNPATQATERVAATKREDGRWAATRPLAAGEQAFVAPGDVCDQYGNYNGATGTAAGVAVPAGVVLQGSACPVPLVPDTVSPAPASEEPAATRTPAALGLPGSAFGFGSPDAGPGRGGAVAGTRSAARRCLPKRLRVRSRGVGQSRLGHRVARVQRRNGLRGSFHRPTLAFCVRGGGIVAVVFSPKGDARLVSTNAPRHEALGGVGAGDTIRKLRRIYPHAVRFRHGYYLTYRSSRVIFRVARGRVRWVAVADRRLILNRSSLTRYLRHAGLAL